MADQYGNDTFTTGSIDLSPPAPPAGPTGGPPQIAAVQTGPTPYTRFTIRTRYETWENDVSLPICNGGNSAAIISLGAPQSTKVVEWKAERLDAWPVMPHWDTGNPNEVLKYKSITPHDPGVLDDGSKLYTVTGIYTYNLVSSPQEGDPLSAGAAPFTIQTALSNLASGYDRTILASATRPQP